MSKPRPSFNRAHDTLARGNATRDEIAVDHAIAPFDEKARAMDRRWGIDRLPSLVSPDLAARYGRTLGSLNEAIAAGDVERAADRAAACVRGMEAMDAAAEAAGHRPPTSGVIVSHQGDYRFGILLDERLWRIAEEEHPHLPIFTLREIGVALRAQAGHPVAAVKDAFPGARVVDIRTKTGKLIDDEIPF